MYLCIELGINCIQNSLVRGMSKENNKIWMGHPAAFQPAADTQGGLLLQPRLCRFCGEGFLKNDVSTANILHKKCSSKHLRTMQAVNSPVICALPEYGLGINTLS